MAAIVGAVAAIGAFVALLLRRAFRGGEPGTAEDEAVEDRPR
jgi:hypothetical protein